MNLMNTIKKVLLRGIPIIGALAASQALAIEGLNLSVQCPDVVLSWPSTPGQNYIIQYRPTLDPSTPWQTLTNFYPADWTTNVTVFVHSNQVECASQSLMSSAMVSSVRNYSPALQEAVLGGQDFYYTTPPPMPDVRVQTNGTYVYVPWEQVYGLVPQIRMPISQSLRERVIESLTQAALESSLAEMQDAPPPPFDDGPLDSGGESFTNSMGFYQVVQDGVQIANSSITNLTNGILSDTLTIRFEAGNADPSNGTNLIGTLSSAVLLIDGEKFKGDGASITAPPTLPWEFTLDTAYLENGDHTVQVEVFWFDPFGNNDGTETMFPSRNSDTVTITVSNGVYYPQWEEQIGEAATNAAFFLKTSCTNADWTLDIYDVGSNFVQQLIGHTDDGIIEAYWNMVDTNGVARTNADVDSEFFAIATVADPIIKKTPPKKRVKNDWPEHGIWTVAYLDYFKHFYSPDNNMKGHINRFALTAQKYGGYWLYYPPAGATNDIGQTYPLRYWDPKHTNEVVTSGQIAKDSAMLKRFLSNTNSRNFFYRGHGGPDQVGYVTASELAKVIKHRYRFVLLQACNTADGSLDHAFGIKGPGQFDIPYYQKSGVRPASFMGNRGKSRFGNWAPQNINGVDYDGTIPWQVPYLYYNFLFYWDAELMGWDLFSSMGEAILDLPAIDGWSYDDHPGRRLTIYGYPFLHIDEYNYRNSW